MLLLFHRIDQKVDDDSKHEAAPAAKDETLSACSLPLWSRLQTRHAIRSNAMGVLERGDYRMLERNL